MTNETKTPTQNPAQNDPTRGIPGQTTIRHDSSFDPNLESRLTRNIEQSIRTKHTARCSWTHLEGQVIPAIKNAILEDFKDHLALMPQKHILASNEPFTITLSFWSRKRMIKKVSHKLLPDFDRAWEDSVEDLTARLPKMLWSLKKVFNSNKAEMLMVAFEWLESVDSAPLKDVLQMVESAKKTGQVS